MGHDKLSWIKKLEHGFGLRAMGGMKARVRVVVCFHEKEYNYSSAVAFRLKNEVLSGLSCVYKTTEGIVLPVSPATVFGFSCRPGDPTRNLPT